MIPKSDLDARAQRRRLVDALYRRYRQALVRFLTGRRFSREEAADIVQEAYCRMHELPDVESIHSPRAFLYRVTRNIASNRQKHERFVVGRGCTDAEALQLAAEDPDPYRDVNGTQELAIVRRAMQELSPKCRRAFIMNRFDELRYAQIAAKMGVSVSMVEKYVSQALAHLRTRLAEAEPAFDRQRSRR